MAPVPLELHFGAVPPLPPKRPEVFEEMAGPDLSLYRENLPEIEKRLADLKPHALICGLGPTAWLLPKVNKDLLAGVRIFGVNDFFKIMPCHDLVVFDSPGKSFALHPNTARFRCVLASTPDRLWLYDCLADEWTAHLPEHLKKVRRDIPLRVWDMHHDPDCMKTEPMLQGLPVCTMAVSPAGAVGIAWSEGCRRIGVLGVDLLMNNNHAHHHLSPYNKEISWFFTALSRQAHQLGGKIVNLSPISRVKFYEEPKT